MKVTDFQKAKQNKQKLTMVTAYDYTMAKIVDEGGADSILVGDSLGMVCLGYKDTLAVTMEDMLHHMKAVRRGTSRALLVGDLPFMSYHVSAEEAVKNAGRLVKEGGAEAVKLEGGADMAGEIRAIVRAQIPVMGHLGLTPQSVNVFGGFRVQGREEARARQLVEDARRLEEAGVCAIVLECVPKALASEISSVVSVPTIGIGAGAGCDGQVLVYQDMLGLYSDHTPKFVKVYAEAGKMMTEGVRRFVQEVRGGIFPDDAHSFEG